MTDLIKDKKDKKYALHPQSDKEGDITLMGNDEKAFLVQACLLKAHSPVLRDMLRTLRSHNTIHLPDISSSGIALIVAASVGQADPAPWSIVKEAVEFCVTCECILLGLFIVHGCMFDVPPDQLFDAFVLTSRIGSVAGASRILERGAITYEWAYVGIGMREALKRWHKGQEYEELSLADVTRLGIRWAHALAQAELGVRKSGMDPESPAYWAALAARFASSANFTWMVIMGSRNLLHLRDTYFAKE